MTPIQEIIDIWINCNSTEIMRWIGSNKERLLEAEKQQNIEFFDAGLINIDLTGEEYYNLICKK